MNRREFVTATALLVAGVGSCDRAQSQDAPAEPAVDWFDRPMRWMQLVLAENDPGQYDAKFWLDYFRRVHADAACLSAGGCVAYYPTKVEHHHRSQWMKNGMDPFGELV